MNIDKWLSLLISFVQIIVWPLFIMIIILAFRRPIKKLLESLEKREVAVKVGVIEATLKTDVATLVTAASQQNEANSLDISKRENPEKIAELVDQTITPETLQKLRKTSILWVDDHPSNNTYVRHALEALGIRFTICVTTKEALNELQLRFFQAIISDLVRNNENDSHAGYTLLEEIKRRDIKIPFILYAAGGNDLRRKEEARQRGAYESISRPPNLYRVIIDLFSK